MYLDVFGDFPNDPLILVITLQDRKTLFCVFYCFRDLYGLKLTGDFSRIIIFQYMTKLSFETTQTEQGGRKEQGWCAHPWARHLYSWPPWGSSAVHPKLQKVPLT